MPMSEEQHRLATRLTALFERLAAAQVDAYLVLSADAHLNEYVPIYQRRRDAITGFTGSAGDALLSPEGSHVFVDSRYYLQADQQIDTTYFRVHKLGMEGAYTLSTWLTEMERQRGSLRVGFDPFSMSMESHASYAAALKNPNSALVPLSPNLVDAVWDDQPPPPAQPFFSLPEAVTGRSAADKLTAIREAMAKASADALILTKLDDIAWVTNLRGNDVSHNPVFEAYLIIEPTQATCFTRVAPAAEVAQALSGQMAFEDYSAYPAAVQRLGSTPERTIWLDHASTTMGTRLLLAESQRLHTARHPVVLMKAVKNAAEITAMKNAHLHAAAAKIRSLARLERQVLAGQRVSELGYSEMLHEEYSSEAGFHDLSFTTIAAAGPNGAIVHYGDASPSVELRHGELLLVDSGVQVLGGTTDDTRTVCIGMPTERQRHLYTLVLRCHIALARQKFPEGTSGVVLDGITRASMWNAGLDYGHGTGHGVGAFLNVHEGPQRIGPRGSDEPLQPGMVVSNEPGYYEEGWGGIRLENLYVITTDDDMPPHPSGKRWLQMESLTLIPFDRQLIDWSQLSDPERAWLARYYQHVETTIAPLLNETDRAWLQEACALPR